MFEMVILVAAAMMTSSILLPLMNPILKRAAAARQDLQSSTKMAKLSVSLTGLSTSEQLS